MVSQSKTGSPITFETAASLQPVWRSLLEHRIQTSAFLELSYFHMDGESGVFDDYPESRSDKFSVLDIQTSPASITSLLVFAPAEKVTLIFAAYFLITCS